jgi:hypothetical protein
MALGLIWENRRMSEQNEVLPENLEVGVWSQDKTYGSKFLKGRVASSLDIWSKVWQGTLF